MSNTITWKGFKGRFWGFVFSSRFLRYLFGFYIYSNKHARTIKKVMKEKLKNGGYFVDLGAGSGFYSVMGAKINKNVKVASVDRAEMMLQRLKTLARKNKVESNITIYKENIESSSIESNSADVIMASNILHELITPEKFISEMYRIIKDDGVIIASEFIDNQFGRKFLSHHTEEVYGPYKYDDLKNFFIKGGFKHVDVDHHNNRLLAIVRK